MKFYLLMRCFLTLSPSTWRKYDQFFIPELVDKKHQGSSRSDNLEEMLQEDLKEKNNYLKHLKKELAKNNAIFQF